MTAALPAATVATLRLAPNHVAQYACDIELALTTHDRDLAVNALAVQLLEDYSGDVAGLAYLAAEAIAQLVQEVGSR